jgi:HAMP domain-containing protein
MEKLAELKAHVVEVGLFVIFLFTFGEFVLRKVVGVVEGWRSKWGGSRTQGVEQAAWRIQAVERPAWRRGRNNAKEDGTLMAMMTLEQRVSELEDKVEQLMQMMVDDSAKIKRMKREISDLEDELKKSKRDVRRLKNS